jgi:hypothetical protein
MKSVAILGLLSLLSSFAAGEDDACPYLLVTGLKRKSDYYEACGYYIASDKNPDDPKYVQIELLSQNCDRAARTCSKTPKSPIHVWAQRSPERDLWMFGGAADVGTDNAIIVAGASDDTVPFSTPASIPEKWHLSDREGGWFAARKMKVECKTKIEDAWLESFPDQDARAGGGGPAPVFSPAFLDVLDLNGDGGLHFQELAEAFVVQGMFDAQEIVQAQSFFDKYDTDGNSFVDKEEWEKSWNADGKDRAAAQMGGGQKPILGGTV